MNSDIPFSETPPGHTKFDFTILLLFSECLRKKIKWWQKRGKIEISFYRLFYLQTVMNKFFTDYYIFICYNINKKTCILLTFL